MATSPTLADPARASATSLSRSPSFHMQRTRRTLSTRLAPVEHHGAARCERLAHDVYGIERLDYSKSLGLLSRASLALGERVSAQPSATSLEHGG